MNPVSVDSNVSSVLRNNRFRRDARSLDEEEAMWFDDEEDLEDGEAIIPMSDFLKNKIDSNKLDSDFEHFKLMESKRGETLHLLFESLL